MCEKLGKKSKKMNKFECVAIPNRKTVVSFINKLLIGSLLDK
jgi:hypothetical protein